MDVVISHLHFNLIYHDKRRNLLYIKVDFTGNYLHFILTGSLQKCQVCVLRENSFVTSTLHGWNWYQIMLFFPGKIVTIETVSVPIINGNVDATGTRWIESANDDAPYAFILRLYTVQDSSDKGTLGGCVVHALRPYFMMTTSFF